MLKKLFGAIIILVICGYFFTHTAVGEKMLARINAMDDITKEDVQSGYNKAIDVYNKAKDTHNKVVDAYKDLKDIMK